MRCFGPNGQNHFKRPREPKKATFPLANKKFNFRGPKSFNFCFDLCQSTGIQFGPQDSNSRHDAWFGAEGSVWCLVLNSGPRTQIYLKMLSLGHRARAPCIWLEPGGTMAEAWNQNVKPKLQIFYFFLVFVNNPNNLPLPPLVATMYQECIAIAIHAKKDWEIKLY